MNPFDLRGPEFLLLFLALSAGAVGLGALIRARLRDTGLPAGIGAPQLDAYQAAYLAGGHGRAVEAAVAELAHRGLLVADPLTRRLRVENEQSGTLHPLEAGVIRVAGLSKETPLDRLTAGLEADTWSLRRVLEQKGLLLTAEERGRSRFMPALPLFALAGFGAIKVAVGIARDRPVVFLVLLCIGAVVGAVVTMLIRPFRTRRGEEVLQNLIQRNAALKVNTSASLATLGGADVPMAVGLFGVGILATGPLADISTTLRPPNSGGGSGCGGSSGCGSGGGCGGGGCGGCGG